MKKILPQKFYNQPTLQVARQLLGKYLVRQIGGQKIKGIITETEAYVGPQDLASHASRGRTPRTAIMFGPPGYWYVYLIYGMYYCLNVVTEKQNYPAAVLIRALKPVSGIETMARHRPNKNFAQLTNGPGKLCQALCIDKDFNGQPAFGSTSLYIEDNSLILSPSQIKTAPRVGVDYAGEYKNKSWRFIAQI